MISDPPAEPTNDGLQLRVLFFIETGGAGGAERVVATLASELRRKGIETGVVTLRTGWLTDQLKLMKVPYFQLESTSRLDVTLIWRLVQLMKKHDYNMLHSHLLDSNVYGALAARFANVYHLGTEHGDVHHVDKKRFLKLKLGLLTLLDTQLTAVSNYTKNRMVELGVHEQRITTVGNPVKLPAHSNRVYRQNARETLEVTEEVDEHWVWIHVANFRLVKDQETLIRGFAKSLSRSSMKQTLVLVGSGPEEDALLRLVKDLGISDKVKFLGFRNDVARWLYAADGFILSSLSEALPMSLLEAGYAGLVLLSSDVGGVSEIIDDGQTGYLFQAGNPDSLADRIVYILDNTMESKYTGARAEQFVQSAFSVDSIISKYLELYW